MIQLLVKCLINSVEPNYHEFKCFSHGDITWHTHFRYLFALFRDLKVPNTTSVRLYLCPLTANMSRTEVAFMFGVTLGYYEITVSFMITGCKIDLPLLSGQSNYTEDLPCYIPTQRESQPFLCRCDNDPLPQKLRSVQTLTPPCKVTTAKMTNHVCSLQQRVKNSWMFSCSAWPSGSWPVFTARVD